MKLAGMMAIVGLRLIVAAAAIVLASCGGGGQDEHDVSTPSVNCAARPAACA